MKPLRTRMEQVSRQTKAPLPVLERDYIISWMLAGISAVAALKENLAFTVDEPILDEIKELPILHAYEEALSTKIPCYSLNEIVLEKMRGILQYKARLERKRSWAKSRARDYYDLWRILNDYPEHVDAAQLPGKFSKKCAARNVVFSDSGQFFEKLIRP